MTNVTAPSAPSASSCKLPGWPGLLLLTAALLWAAAGSPPTVPVAYTAPLVPKVLGLSDQARRYLALQARSFTTEFLGCMIGELRGDSVVVNRIAPADVDPAQSTTTRVVPERTCEQAGWSGTIGRIHSHPTREACWYYFPGTRVPSSDGQSFVQGPYPVDAILCGDTVVWIGRTVGEQRLPLTAVKDST